MREDAGERMQVITFAIHTPDQPNVPCSRCQQGAMYIVLLWTDGAADKMEAHSYCRDHFGPLRYYEQLQRDREGGGDA